MALKKENQFSNDPIIRAQEEDLQHRRSSARQTVEWGMRVLQGTFSRLHVAFKAHDTENNLMIIKLCIHLCNLRTRRMGIFNQIQTVFREELNEQ